MTPFLGQLMLFPFGFAPKGWAQCSGQVLPINQNQALFALLGTTFGGDGRTTFALPDLRGRVPAGVGQNISLGQRGGEEAHTLTVAEVPSHTHMLQGDASAPNAKPANNFLGQNAQNVYVQGASPNATLAAGTVSNVGGSQPHENRSPFLVLTWCIALEGIFPSQN